MFSFTFLKDIVYIGHFSPAAVASPVGCALCCRPGLLKMDRLQVLLLQCVQLMKFQPKCIVLTSLAPIQRVPRVCGQPILHSPFMVGGFETLKPADTLQSLGESLVEAEPLCCLLFGIPVLLEQEPEHM